MRILSLTENFPPETNAAATRVYERACYWADWGHEVTVITTSSTKSYIECMSQHVEKAYL